MAKEYIEREVLLKDIQAAKEHAGMGSIIAGSLTRYVKRIPAANVVEVVRCKDCKYYGWEQEPCHGRVGRFCKLSKGLVAINKETFCCYGERKEDGNISN